MNSLSRKVAEDAQKVLFEDNDTVIFGEKNIGSKEIKQHVTDL